MKNVTMTIQARMGEWYFNAVTIYQLDDDGRIISEKGLLHELGINREFTIGSDIEKLKLVLNYAISQDSCPPNGNIVIEVNSVSTAMPLNNKQDCENALKTLQEMMPTYANSLPVAQHKNTWTTNAYDFVRANRLPFLLGAVIVGAALTESHHRSLSKYKLRNADVI